jgi:pimeloyl-ACP methyl ester carboxylesterase
MDLAPLRELVIAMLAIVSAPYRTLGADARDQVISDHFDSKGVSLHYTVQGAGEPVILIHGLYSSGRMNWGYPGIIKALAKEYRVIALDVRGHGQSGKPAEESAYGLELVDDILRLLDHLKIPKAHIVGYSMGGMITLKFAALHPDRVKSATLGGMGWLRQGSALQELWGQLPNGRAGATPAVCARSLGALALSKEELLAIRIPAIVLIGDRDPIRKLYVVPLESARKDWPVKVIENAGHINCIFRAQFQHELKKWLDAQKAAGAKPPH